MIDFAGHPFTFELSKKFSQMGYEVHYLYNVAASGPKAHFVDIPNLYIEPLMLGSKFSKYSIVGRFMGELRTFWEIRKLIKKYPTDFVFFANMPIITLTLSVRVLLSANIKFLYWLQDLHGEAILRTKNLNYFIAKMAWALGNIIRFLEIKSLKAASKVVCITQDFIPILEKYGIDRDRMTVIPNWSPIEEISLFEKSNEWSEKNGLSNTFNIVYSGTLGLKHNPKLFLELSDYFKKYEQVRIVVISEGLGAQFLHENGKDYTNLKVMDFVNFKTLSFILSSSDILVAILEKEAGIFSVPSKVLTYLCAEKPLVISIPKDNLAAKLVNQIEGGIVVEPDNIQEFLDAVEKLYQDQTLREKYSKNARRYAEENFEIEKVFGRFEQLTKDSINSK